jgi:hypothetical protein
MGNYSLRNFGVNSPTQKNSIAKNTLNIPLKKISCATPVEIEPNYNAPLLNADTVIV